MEFRHKLIAKINSNIAGIKEPAKCVALALLTVTVLFCRIKTA